MISDIAKKVSALSSSGFDVSLFFYSGKCFEKNVNNLPDVYRIYAPGSCGGILKNTPVLSTEFIEETDIINKRPKSGITEHFCGKTLGNIGDFGNIEEKTLLCGDIGLNIYNSVSAAAYEELASSKNCMLSSITLSPERSFKELCSLASKIVKSSHVRPEIIVYGRVPVMKCEHCFVSGMAEPVRKGDNQKSENCGNCAKHGTFYMKDEKDGEFPLLTVPEYCQSVVFSSAIINYTEEILKTDILPKKTILRFNIFDEEI